MAENKKGFILYADQKEIFELLPLDKRGQLITIVFEYVNDENPTVDDPLINMAFTLIKQVLKRDLKKYENKKKQYSEAGKKSAEARKKRKEAEQNSTNSTNVKNVERTSTNSTVTVKDNVNDTVNVNVKESKEIKNALDFLKQNALISFEQIEMKYSRGIKDWDNMLDSFNLKVEEEELEYKPRILLARFERYCKNWMTFSNKQTGNNKKTTKQTIKPHRQL